MICLTCPRPAEVTLGPEPYCTTCALAALNLVTHVQTETLQALAQRIAELYDTVNFLLATCNTLAKRSVPVVTVGSPN